MRARFAAAPTEIRLVALLLTGAGVAFLALGLALFGADARAGAGSLRMPVAAVLLGVLAGAGLLLRVRLALPVAMVLLVVFALLHLLIVFGDGPWWARAGSALLVGCYLYAAVLLNTGPAGRYLRGDSDG